MTGCATQTRGVLLSGPFSLVSEGFLTRDSMLVPSIERDDSPLAQAR